MGRADDVKVTTNNRERDIIHSHDVTPRERKILDYVDWDAVDAGNDSWSGFRFRGEVWDLAEFEAFRDDPKWHGWQTQSAFDAIVVRYNDTYDGVVVGHMTW